MELVVESAKPCRDDSSDDPEMPENSGRCSMMDNRCWRNVEARKGVEAAGEPALRNRIGVADKLMSLRNEQLEFLEMRVSLVVQNTAGENVVESILGRRAAAVALTPNADILLPFRQNE